MPVALGVNGGIFPVDNLPSPTLASGVWTMNEVERHIRAGRWPVLSSLPGPGEYLDIEHVFSFDTGSIMAIDPTDNTLIYGVHGSNTGPAVSTDSGLTWTVVSGHLPGMNYGIGSGLLLRVSGYDVYSSSDKGATWSGPYTAPTISAGGWNNIGWSSGGNWFLWTETSHDTATSSDGGHTWTLHSSALSTNPTSDFGVNHTTGTIIIPDGAGTTTYHRSTDGGATWTALTYPFATAWVPSCDDAGNWFGTSWDSDGIASSSDDGLTFTTRTLPFATTGAGGNQALPVIPYGGDWYATVSSNKAASSGDVGVWKTTDLGATWTQLAYDSATRDNGIYQAAVAGTGILVMEYDGATDYSVMLYGIP